VNFFREPSSRERYKSSISLTVVKYMMCDAKNVLQISPEVYLDVIRCVA
jgi:hypothetical protein